SPCPHYPCAPQGHPPAGDRRARPDEAILPRRRGARRLHRARRWLAGFRGDRQALRRLWLPRLVGGRGRAGPEEKPAAQDGPGRPRRADEGHDRRRLHRRDAGLPGEVGYWPWWRTWPPHPHPDPRPIGARGRWATPCLIITLAPF